MTKRVLGAIRVRDSDVMRWTEHKTTERMHEKRRQNTTEKRNESRDYSSAEPSLPSLTRRLQSCRQVCMFARSFLSEMTFSIQKRSAFSSSGTKKDDSKESTLSKLAELDVM